MEKGGGENRDSGVLQACVKCGYPIPEVPLGCKSFCPNCKYLYPLGDCSD